jgi:hypothetical protein
MMTPPHIPAIHRARVVRMQFSFSNHEHVPISIKDLKRESLERTAERAERSKHSDSGSTQLWDAEKQKAKGKIRLVQRTQRRFATRYAEIDVGLLAEVDRAHERLNGLSTRRILQREYQEFGRKEYERLAGISASHIHNLRRSPAYRRKAVGFERTKPTGVSIAERRRPDPTRDCLGASALARSYPPLLCRNDPGILN